MRRLVWDASFRRAFKQRTRRQPPLQALILDVLETLAENPFEPSLKTHKLHGQCAGGHWLTQRSLLSDTSLAQADLYS